jgi:hypothetical protein
MLIVYNSSSYIIFTSHEIDQSISPSGINHQKAGFDENLLLV